MEGSGKIRLVSNKCDTRRTAAGPWFCFLLTPRPAARPGAGWGAQATQPAETHSDCPQQPSLGAAGSRVRGRPDGYGQHKLELITEQVSSANQREPDSGPAGTGIQAGKDGGHGAARAARPQWPRGLWGEKGRGRRNGPGVLTARPGQSSPLSAAQPHVASLPSLSDAGRRPVLAGLLV